MSYYKVYLRCFVTYAIDVEAETPNLALEEAYKTYKDTSNKDLSGLITESIVNSTSVKEIKLS